MKQKKLAFSILCFTALLSLNSCEMFKVYPGRQGDSGPAGAVGEKGDKGPAGDKGSLSGVVSAWTEIKPDQWTLQNGVATFRASEPALTQAMLDQGLILNYYRIMPEDESSMVIALTDITHTYVFNAKVNVGEFTYEVHFKDLKQVNPKMKDWNIKVRHILVPPAAAGRIAAANWKDYNEVKRILDLKD